MKIQPVLFATFCDPVPAYHAAPPVAVELEIARKSTLTVPLDFDKTCGVADVEFKVVLAAADTPVSVKSSNKKV